MRIPAVAFECSVVRYQQFTQGGMGQVEQMGQTSGPLVLDPALGAWVRLFDVTLGKAAIAAETASENERTSSLGGKAPWPRHVFMVAKANDLIASTALTDLDRSALHHLRSLFGTDVLPTSRISHRWPSFSSHEISVSEDTSAQIKELRAILANDDVTKIAGQAIDLLCGDGNRVERGQWSGAAWRG